MIFFKANSQFGGVDILVSNAAVNPSVGSVLDVKLTCYVAKYFKNQHFKF